MRNLFKYLPYILAAALFFVGRCSSPKPDKDLIRKYELERKTILKDIARRDSIIKALDRQGLSIREKMVKDSLVCPDERVIGINPCH